MQDLPQRAWVIFRGWGQPRSGSVRVTRPTLLNSCLHSKSPTKRRRTRLCNCQPSWTNRRQNRRARMSLLQKSICNCLQLPFRCRRWATPPMLRRLFRAFWFLRCCYNTLATQPTNPSSQLRRWNFILHLRPLAEVPRFTYRAKFAFAWSASFALIALLFFSVSAAEPGSAPSPHDVGSSNKAAIALPEKASDDEIELLEGTRSN